MRRISRSLAVLDSTGLAGFSNVRNVRSPRFARWLLMKKANAYLIKGSELMSRAGPQTCPFPNEES